MRCVFVILASLAVLTGCNTVQGIGKDIESVGRKGEQVLDGNRKT
jgi:predicted small secreted protein